MKISSVLSIALTAALATFLTSVQVVGQQAYVTPWFQFDISESWSKLDQGEEPPNFPSLFSKSYGGYQANISITFGGPVSESLTDLAGIKRNTFDDVLPGHTVIANRFFNTDYGFAANEYYIDFQGNRFRYIDVLVPYDGGKYLGSFRASMPSTDSSKETDKQVLAMVNSVRPVIEGPKITSEPKSSAVKEGKTLFLSIAVSSEAEYSTEWYRNGAPLAQNSNTLTIPDFKQIHVGEYWAVVKNFAGEDRSSTVNISLEPNSDTLTIIEQPVGKTIKHGYPAQLRVSVRSEENYSIEWFKDGYSRNQFGETLEINEFSYYHSGTYWAQITHGDEILESKRVDLLWEPANSIPYFIKDLESKVVQRGTTVELFVEAGYEKWAEGDGYSLRWYHNGEEMRERQAKIRITNFSEQHEGEYWVVISYFSEPWIGDEPFRTNEGVIVSSKSRLTLKPPSDIPTIVMPYAESSEVSAGAGGQIRIAPIIEGNQPMTYQWYKDDVKLSDQLEAVLLINKALYKDSGKYHLIVRNDFGVTTSSAVTWNVPQSKPPKDIRIELADLQGKPKVGQVFAHLWVEDEDQHAGHIIVINGQNSKFFDIVDGLHFFEPIELVVAQDLGPLLGKTINLPLTVTDQTNESITVSKFITLHYDQYDTEGRLIVETVPVGDPGNPNEKITGKGAVNYDYRITKYEITNAQWAHFLNCVDPDGMGSGLWKETMSISRSPGDDGNLEYKAKASEKYHPVRFVDPFDAARYANWLTNGQPRGEQGKGVTEDGMYNLAGNPKYPVRSFDIGSGKYGWAIPTHSEWLKAAYYDPSKDSGFGGYWPWPWKVTNPPHVVGPQDPELNLESPNSANISGATAVEEKFEDGEWIMGTPAGPLPVGFYSNTTNYYGTYDQGGNLAEWIYWVGNEPNSNGLVSGHIGGNFNEGIWNNKRIFAGGGSDFPAGFRDIGIRLVRSAVDLPDNVEVSQPSLKSTFNIFVEDSLIRLEAETESGISYQLQSSSDLIEWTADGPIFLGDGEKVGFYRANKEISRFYRVITK
jgi:formylglycine-generating enzyme required for sulfatase activity